MANQQQAQPQPITAYFRNILHQRIATLTNLMNLEQFLDQLDAIKTKAKARFANYDGDLAKLTAETFDYINEFVAINDQIVAADTNIFKNIEVIMLIMPEEDDNDRLVVNKWIEIKTKRDNVARFLRLGGYADQEQLENGYNQQQENAIPFRFYFNHPSKAKLLVERFLNLADKYVNYPQLFEENKQLAIQSLREYQNLTIADQNEPERRLFDFIDSFRRLNNEFMMDEDLIPDNLLLVLRIAIQMPGLVSQQQLERVQQLRNRFVQVRNKRNEVRQFLVNNDYATGNQLLYGFDSFLPPAFVREKRVRIVESEQPGVGCDGTLEE